VVRLKAMVGSRAGAPAVTYAAAGAFVTQRGAVAAVNPILRWLGTPVTFAGFVECARASPLPRVARVTPVSPPPVCDRGFYFRTAAITEYPGAWRPGVLGYRGARPFRKTFVT
jgi:hypothetical protein